MSKISVVINTLNEEKNIERAIRSVKSFADEVLVCDMNSDDNSALLAKKLGAKVIFTKRLDFVEPARNFAISKASGDWILILDPDEEVPESLLDKLKDFTKDNSVTTFVEIPRKNLIFGKWVKGSMWWPDNNIRFFKKESIKWSDKIHRPPQTEGQGITLPMEERYAITHHHYQSISQFLTRLDRYTNVQAREMHKNGEKFNWTDLISKPLGEFLGRFFANKGYIDGLHGLVLALLQAFSYLVMYLKLWELEGFESKELKLSEVKVVTVDAGKELDYWFKYGNLSKNPLKNFLQRAKNKLPGS